jgi:hypothetical protein
MQEIRFSPEVSGTPFRSSNPSPLRQLSLDTRALHRKSPNKQSEPTVRTPISTDGHELLVFRKRKRRPIKNPLQDRQLQDQLESIQQNIRIRKA